MTELDCAVLDSGEFDWAELDIGFIIRNDLRVLEKKPKCFLRFVRIIKHTLRHDDDCDLEKMLGARHDKTCNKYHIQSKNAINCEGDWTVSVNAKQNYS